MDQMIDWMDGVDESRRSLKWSWLALGTYTGIF